MSPRDRESNPVAASTAVGAGTRARRGERWVRFVGRTNHPWLPILSLALSGVMLTGFVRDGDWHRAVFSASFLLLAVLQYERGQFARIVERQDEELAALQKEFERACDAAAAPR